MESGAQPGFGKGGGAILKEWELCKRPWPEFSLFLNQFHTVCPKIETKFLGKLGNSQVFSAQNQVVSKKKKKKKGLHRNWDWFFGPNRKSKRLRGGCFPMGGLFLIFFTKNRPQNHQKRAILHTLQAYATGWSPRGHILKSLASKVKSLALASRSQVLENWPVLGSRTALFFELLKFCEALKKFLWRPFFFWRALALVSLVLGLGLEHSCPWPRERLSSERLSLALASDFFCVLGLGLEPCVLDSTSGF